MPEKERGIHGKRDAQGEADDLRKAAKGAKPRVPAAFRQVSKPKKEEAKPVETPPSEYEVQPGDSLSKIAQELLGDGNRWPEIFEANKGLIKDPNLIYPGQKLTIPR